jgi:hypothetical protein
MRESSTLFLNRTLSNVPPAKIDFQVESLHEKREETKQGDDYCEGNKYFCFAQEIEIGILEEFYHIGLSKDKKLFCCKGLLPERV